jgi:hypothetical protein
VNGVVEIREVPTADNISDVFSKTVTVLRVRERERVCFSELKWDRYREFDLCSVYIVCIWKVVRGGYDYKSPNLRLNWSISDVFKPCSNICRGVIPCDSTAIYMKKEDVVSPWVYRPRSP